MGSGVLHECGFATSVSMKACPLAIDYPAKCVRWCPVSNLTKTMDMDMVRNEDFDGRSLDRNFVLAKPLPAPVTVPRAARNARAKITEIAAISSISVAPLTDAMRKVDAYNDAADVYKAEIRSQREKIMEPVLATVRSVVEFLVSGPDRSGSDTSAVRDMEKAVRACAAAGADFVSLVTWMIGEDSRYRVLGLVSLFDPEEPKFPPRRPDPTGVEAVIKEVSEAYATLSLYTGSVSIHAFTLAYLQFRTTGIWHGGKRADWLLQPMPSLAELIPSEEYTMRTLSTWTGKKLVSRDVTTAMRVLPKAMRVAAENKQWPMKQPR